MRLLSIWTEISLDLWSLAFRECPLTALHWAVKNGCRLITSFTVATYRADEIQAAKSIFHISIPWICMNSQNSPTSRPQPKFCLIADANSCSSSWTFKRWVCRPQPHSLLKSISFSLSCTDSSIELLSQITFPCLYGSDTSLITLPLVIRNTLCIYEEIEKNKIQRLLVL